MKKISSVLKKDIAHLSEVCPLPYKTISVRLVDPKTIDDDAGECETSIDKCYIRINETINLDRQRDILEHEWAHALGDYMTMVLKQAGLNYVADFLQDHGITWSLCYGYVYQNANGTL
ncbi:hypothetical protein LCGC14_3169280 [marine sediment metagenome]|uniref:IrrE N-terminal-like domain-containing protein n=1 Tax=marine sediment metagenome TaxID=412755 RepID=A0A0F8W444_9ZZZZ